jgi:4-amino-4-deoxy-L-arabinose transferase-like glycosyltransferase
LPGVAKSHVLKWFVLIAFVALALRVYSIDRLPPGLFSDEAVEGLDALDVMAGNFQIWFHAGLGREPLFVYLVAASYAHFGVSPLTTRLPAIIAGIVTVPVTFLLVKEWGTSAFRDDRSRATRLALLTSGLLAISFWHVQMSRNAHRDILLPLVQAIGFFFLWRALRTREWKMFAASGAVLGLAIYTYSPGRFVGVLLAIFFAIELLAARFGNSRQIFQWRGVTITAVCALIVMVPIGIYFAQNPLQFIRRFDSASIFNASEPISALASSVSGNLTQFVIPGSGYESQHYNLPGKPVFDLFLAPWFIAGIILALVRLRAAEYRFLLLWFVVMMVPPFLTSDMIPKGVRGFGTLPGALIFVAIAMDALFGRAERMRESPQWQRAVTVLTGLTFIGSALWTTFDYFVAWANLPSLPIAFDADYVEVGEYVNRLPPDQSVLVSAEVYRHPVFMLLGKHVPTSRFFDRSSQVKEFDANSTLVSTDSNAITVFVRDQSPSEDWYRRLAPENEPTASGRYFAAYRLRDLALPQRRVDESFNPVIALVGYSAYFDDPRGVALYWRIASLPSDRTDTQVTVTFLDARGQVVASKQSRFGYPPMEWAVGEDVVEWFEIDEHDGASGSPNEFMLELSRGDESWKSKTFISQ